VTSLLIVHHDAEIGRELARVVKEFTGYDSALTTSESETLVWLRRQPEVRPRILLTQLDAPGLDGFSLAAILSEMFAGLQTLFLPPYASMQARIEIAGSKVFPEPIDGDRLIATIERSVRMRWDAPDWFHVVDVLQMCCLARRSGALQIVRGSRIGAVYLRDGAIIHAETSGVGGYPALVEMVSWGEIEFAYDRAMTTASETLRGRWDQLLNDALEENKRSALPEWRRQTA
jgi:CheY-like chemotaxis protein